MKVKKEKRGANHDAAYIITKSLHLMGCPYLYNALGHTDTNRPIQTHRHRHRNRHRQTDRHTVYPKGPKAVGTSISHPARCTGGRKYGGKVEIMYGIAELHDYIV